MLTKSCQTQQVEFHLSASPCRNCLPSRLLLLLFGCIVVCAHIMEHSMHDAMLDVGPLLPIGQSRIQVSVKVALSASEHHSICL